MKNRYLVTLLLSLLLISPNTCLAQSAELTALKKHLDPSKGLQVSYTLTIGDFVSNGIYYADKGGKFVLDSPEIKAWYDGSNLWLYSQQSEEVHLTAPTTEELTELNPLISLEAIHLGDFTITKTEYGLKATPRQPKRWRIEWLEIYTDRAHRPLRVLLKERGTDWIQEIKVHKIVKERTPEMQLPHFYRFVKNKLSGVDVIDLR